VRLLGDQQRDPAGVPVAREPDLDVHVELAPELGERAPELAPEVSISEASTRVVIRKTPPRTA